MPRSLPFPQRPVSKTNIQVDITKRPLCLWSRNRHDDHNGHCKCRGACLSQVHIPERPLSLWFHYCRADYNSHFKCRVVQGACLSHLHIPERPLSLWFSQSSRWLYNTHVLQTASPGCMFVPNTHIETINKSMVSNVDCIIKRGTQQEQGAGLSKLDFSFEWGTGLSV